MNKNKNSENDRQPIQRPGFTLIEVLIALGLSLLLMTAVYAAISMHYRYQTLGRTEQHRSQIFRSIVRRINVDVNSIVMQLPEEELDPALDGGSDDSDDSSSTSNSSSTSAFNTATTIFDDESDSSSLTFGLIGDGQTLHMTVSHPSRSLSYSSVNSENSASTRTSDLVTVTYSLAPIDLQWYQNNDPRYAGFHVSDYLPTDGMGRRLLDIYGTEPIETALEKEDLLALEISEVQFQYYDGSAWIESWDSLESGKLPRAIKMTVGFWNEPGKNVDSSAAVTLPATTKMSHVFYFSTTIPEAVF